MVIGIVGALREEVSFLEEKLQRKEKKQLASYTVWHGFVEGKECWLLRSGIGKVHAAVGTSLLIDRFKADLIINMGSAGALVNSLSHADLVISKQVAYWDCDVGGFGYSVGQIPNAPLFYQAEEALLKRAEKAAKDLRFPFQTGTILTGDSFVGDAQVQLATFFAQHDTGINALAVDMEAAAVGQACFLHRVPFVVIRGISDLPQEDNLQAFKQHLESAAERSGKAVYQILLGW